MTIVDEASSLLLLKDRDKRRLRGRCNCPRWLGRASAERHGLCSWWQAAGLSSIRIPKPMAPKVRFLFDSHCLALLLPNLFLE